MKEYKIRKKERCDSEVIHFYTELSYCIGYISRIFSLSFSKFRYLFLVNQAHLINRMNGILCFFSLEKTVRLY